MVPNCCWNLIRSRSAQLWGGGGGLIWSCDSSASEFPVQERGLFIPPQHCRQNKCLFIVGWGGERDVPRMGPSILSTVADGTGGWGTEVSPHFSLGILWLLPVVRLSVSAAGCSQGFWVLMTYFLFGPFRFCWWLCLWRLAWNNLKLIVFVLTEQRDTDSQSRLRGLVAYKVWEKRSRSCSFERLLCGCSNNDCYMGFHSKNWHCHKTPAHKPAGITRLFRGHYSCAGEPSQQGLPGQVHLKPKYCFIRPGKGRD